MNIEVKKSPYTSKLGGDIDIIFSTDDGWVFNTVANISRKDLRKLKRKIRRYLNEEKEESTDRDRKRINTQIGTVEI